MKILIIYKLGSRKCTTQNDLHQQYESKCVLVLIETNFIDYKCFHMNAESVCVVVPHCGDGARNLAGEECDDRNTAPPTPNTL